MKNIHGPTVEGFGHEWSTLAQDRMGFRETKAQFHRYFAVFPWEDLPQGAEGIDVGCGSGRWAALVAPQVGRLHCIDASEKALEVARRNLGAHPNVAFHLASASQMPVEDGSLDFGYSLGVLHHVPDTQGALVSCVRTLKAGAPFLVYLYYAMENRPLWFRGLWQVSNLARRIISRFPFQLRRFLSFWVAALVYFPLARLARFFERLGAKVEVFPLSMYRTMSFYTMRTDALDRFGTRLEKRFSRGQIKDMMEAAGLEDIRFHEDVPFWCAVGWKAEWDS
ncbi:class I SAM-dependent methyltransferase [Gemmatimonadota bacterium]